MSTTIVDESREIEGRVCHFHVIEILILDSAPEVVPVLVDARPSVVIL